jgi:hypothetical protein
VQAAPKNFTGSHWIPAEHVVLEEKWSGDITKMKVGEPLTRTLTLFSKGTTVSQLPELYQEKNNPQLKTYPDQPVLKEQKKEDYILALREEKIAYIPSEAGTHQLPEIEIQWFNTQTQKMEVARIPATTITAIAPQQSLSKQPTTANAVANSIQAEPTAQTVTNHFWMWLSLFLAIGWLITLFFLVKKGQHKEDKDDVLPTKKEKRKVAIKEAIREVKLACKNNDQVAAKNALLAWGRIKFSSHNLSETASYCDTYLKDEIGVLNQALYSHQSVNWSGKPLLQAFAENHASKKLTGKVDNKLEPLYKIK